MIGVYKHRSIDSRFIEGSRVTEGAVPGEGGGHSGAREKAGRFCHPVHMSNWMYVSMGGVLEGQAVSGPVSGRIAAPRGGPHGDLSTGRQAAPPGPGLHRITDAPEGSRGAVRH